MNSYESPYAKLAAEGINVLSVIMPHEDTERGSEYIFEYSWNDPKQGWKLHWSKSVYQPSYSVGMRVEDWADDLIRVVSEARKELEA